MSVVLIVKGGYECSCGASLTKPIMAKGKCPGCGEQLTEVMFKEQYKPEVKPDIVPDDKPKAPAKGKK